MATKSKKSSSGSSAAKKTASSKKGASNNASKTAYASTRFAAAEVLAVLDSTSYLTNIKIQQVTSDAIVVGYNSLPDNRPNTYGNFIAIWQNQNQIPWDQDPISTQSIPNDQQQGTVFFPGLTVQDNDYIIGWSVGPTLSTGQKYGNVCSTAFVPKGSNNDPSKIIYSYSNLVLGYVGQNAVLVQFSTPKNCRPVDNGAWLGMWRGGASYKNTPDYSIPVTVNANKGSAGFNNTPLGIGNEYTIAYFMSGWSKDPTKLVQTAMACTIDFTAGG